jgi:enoyl-[acyl-carrier protein] reductase / trans-2-enoyl-CoA reductase (NAD+)
MGLQVLTARGRGFIMVNAHPLGCAAEVASQFSQAVAARVSPRGGPALIIGSSTGYGLASRVALASGGTPTVGVFLERAPRGDRTASAGWYNTVAFHEVAGGGHFSVNGDAFSDETKRRDSASAFPASTTKNPSRPTSPSQKRR